MDVHTTMLKAFTFTLPHSHSHHLATDPHLWFKLWCIVKYFTLHYITLLAQSKTTNRTQDHVPQTGSGIMRYF